MRRSKISRRQFNAGLSMSVVSFAIPVPEGVREGEPPLRLSYTFNPPEGAEMSRQEWVLCVANSDGKCFEYPILDPKNIEVPCEVIPKDGSVRMWVRGFISWEQPHE